MKASEVLHNDYQDRSKISWSTQLAKKLIHKKLSKIQFGQIKLIDEQDEYNFGEIDACYTLHARINVKNMSFYSKILLGGSIAAGETYMRGDWDSDDLLSLVRIMVLNRDLLTQLDSGLSWVQKCTDLPFHILNNNSKKGSKRNIQAHYDIGNELYKLFLDESMMYSSAIYATRSVSLYEGSIHKLDIVCKKLQLSDKDHLLEIGTGWGALALHAAQQNGCRVTTTTISEEQYFLAMERVKAAGLTDKITVLKKDYRDIHGKFDKLVSIEMLEAVGYQHYDTFFRKCNSLLKDDGLMVLQTITITDQYYQYAKRSVDFIQRYIFPGGCLPSINVLTDCISRKTDMRLHHMDDFSEHYARTLRDWRDRFVASIDKVRKLGYSDQFIRMWEFYLCYCEGGFLERSIGVVQLTLRKPLNRREYIGSML